MDNTSRYFIDRAGGLCPCILFETNMGMTRYRRIDDTYRKNHWNKSGPWYKLVESEKEFMLSAYSEITKQEVFIELL